MGRIRHQDLLASRIAPGIVIGTYHGHPGEFTLGARRRAQGHRMHAGDLFEYLLQFIQAGHETLAVGLGSQRMAGQETG